MRKLVAKLREKTFFESIGGFSEGIHGASSGAAEASADFLIIKN